MMSMFFPSDNLYKQHFFINKKQRSILKGHSSFCIWLTGLSGAGKSTLANHLEKHLHHMGVHTYLLDGDNVRRGLCCDLNFSQSERSENIRRVAEVSKLMVDAGLVVISAFISPLEKERETVRALFDKNEFVEVFVDASLAVCEKRDVKGLYKQARLGEVKNFTGVDSEYQKPTESELHIDTDQASVKNSVDAVIDYLICNKLIN